METHHRPFIRLDRAPVDYPEHVAANDDFSELPPGAAMLEAWGGRFGFIVSILIAVALGYIAAVQL